MKMGAGVQVWESYKFSGDHGYTNVDGDCATVGVAGGYTQGGGHGPGASKFEPAADQALEWEVVTGEGEVLTANMENNTDLFWALSGGGGGTYGVVSSLTAKVYPDLKSSAANLTFPSEGVNNDSWWDAVETFIHESPNLMESGCFAIWSFEAEDGFMMRPTNCPGLPQAELQKILDPTLEKLKQHNISHKFLINEFDTFYDSYKTFNARHLISPSVEASRLVTRDSFDSKFDDLMSLYRTYVENCLSVGTTANNISMQGFPPHNNSLDPFRREAVFNTIFSLPMHQTDWEENMHRYSEITGHWLPMMEELTPGARAYIKEADWQQPDWQTVFYGENYPKLLEIKDKYDPDQIFFAVTAVGSDRWYQNYAEGGRLCRA